VIILLTERWAVSGEQPPDGPGLSVFLVPPPSDRALLRRFVDLLERHGIEWGLASADVSASNALDFKVTNMTPGSCPPAPSWSGRRSRIGACFTPSWILIRT